MFACPIKQKIEYPCIEAEFKEFKPRLKFETRLKYGWLVALKIVFNALRFQPALN